MPATSRRCSVPAGLLLRRSGPVRSASDRGAIIREYEGTNILAYAIPDRRNGSTNCEHDNNTAALHSPAIPKSEIRILPPQSSGRGRSVLLPQWPRENGDDCDQ